MQKSKSYALLQYQKEVKPLTRKEMTSGLVLNVRLRTDVNRKVDEALICNLDRWGKDVVEKDMFLIKPLLKYVDTYFFNHPAVVGFFFGGVVVYFLIMCVVAKFFGAMFRY